MKQLGGETEGRNNFDKLYGAWGTPDETRGGAHKYKRGDIFQLERKKREFLGGGQPLKREPGNFFFKKGQK